MEQDEKNENKIDKSDVKDNKSGDNVHFSENALSEEKAPLINEKRQNGDSLKDNSSESSKTINADANKSVSQSKVTSSEETKEETSEKDIGKIDSKAELETKKQPKKIPKTLKAIIYSFCIITASVILAVVVLLSVTDYLGMFRAEKTANVEIPSNATPAQIASILKEDGIIRSPLVFRTYITISKKQGLKNGTFTLNSQMSYRDIVRTLENLANRSTVKVTIPEGYTLQSIGALLEKNNVCTKHDFLASAGSAKISFDFQSQIPNNAKRFYRLEGYLFPDTYEFYINQSADSVVEKMLTNFDNRFDADLRSEVKKSGMTVDQIVTLASIIQTEAGKTSEMSMVSSVFHNRLKNGVSGLKLLQSDATVLYGTNDIKPVLTSSGSQVASAYDTYKHEGLPPGAICNPGIDAIKAALSPDTTSYYFFVSDKSGNYYYAKTYAKHLKNVNEAMKTGAAVGTDVTK